MNMSDKKAPALTIYDKQGITAKSPLMTEQILHIMQKTPAQHIYRRPAKGGGEWEYVTGTYVEKVLNYVFAWDWDFEIKQHGRENNLVWVLGTLKVRTHSGRQIVKEQFGRADIKKSRQGGDLDFGNDLKAAATDALKKCASQLGIASDVYGKDEFKEINMNDVTEPAEEQPATEAQKETLLQLGLEVKNGLTFGEARDILKNLAEKRTK